jgi:hypothetical protein
MGVLAIGLVFASLFAMPFIGLGGGKFRIITEWLYWTFLADVLLLTWLGGQEITPITSFMGQCCTAYLFLYLLVCQPLVGYLETQLMHGKVERNLTTAYGLPGLRYFSTFKSLQTANMRIKHIFWAIMLNPNSLGVSFVVGSISKFLNVQFLIDWNNFFLVDFFCINFTLFVILFLFPSSKEMLVLYMGQEVNTTKTAINAAKTLAVIGALNVAGTLNDTLTDEGERIRAERQLESEESIYGQRYEPERRVVRFNEIRDRMHVEGQNSVFKRLGLDYFFGKNQDQDSTK